MAGLLLTLFACNPDEVPGGGASFRVYAGEVGRLYELRAPVVAGDTGETGDTGGLGPVGPTRWLRIDEGSWTLSEGDDVDVAAVVSTWTTRLQGGLFVDEVRLLPETVTEGAAADGASVTAIGPWTTWYGTFPEAAEVAITDGNFAGTQVFASGVGPVFLTVGGVAWETAWYE